MVALWNRAEHYIFALWFLLLILRILSSFFSSPNLSRCRKIGCLPHGWPQCEFRMQVWNVLHAARWNTGHKKVAKIAIWAPSHNFVGLYLRNEGTYWQLEKNLLSSNTSSICPQNMAYFSPLTAEIGWPVWGTPANFYWFRILASLLHGI